MRINLLILLLLITGGCGRVFNISGHPPSKSSFKYYDPDFKFPKNAKLKTDEYYIMKVGQAGDSSIKIMAFFQDGLVNSYTTYYTPNKLKYDTAIRYESGGPHGYYKIIDDSVFFNLDVYYRGKPYYYNGVIKNEEDSLILTVKYKIHWWKKWQEKEERYVIFDKWGYKQ